ncbi:MAG: 1-acyl-sn-glycerol-3-phosphate acyltransferase [Clostridiales bacterium]|nr:1-acyl-sn-glycerol-3-phosphate acyltransferase [Clostridiales bacterium]
MPTQGPVLLVANHTSLLDIPAIHMRLKPWIYWVSKKELFKAPVIGSFFCSHGLYSGRQAQGRPPCRPGYFRCPGCWQNRGHFPPGNPCSPGTDPGTPAPYRGGPFCHQNRCADRARSDRR